MQAEQNHLWILALPRWISLCALRTVVAPEMLFRTQILACLTTLSKLAGATQPAQPCGLATYGPARAAAPLLDDRLCIAQVAPVHLPGNGRWNQHVNNVKGKCKRKACLKRKAPKGHSWGPLWGPCQGLFGTLPEALPEAFLRPA